MKNHSSSFEFANIYNTIIEERTHERWVWGRHRPRVTGHGSRVTDHPKRAHDTMHTMQQFCSWLCLCPCTISFTNTSSSYFRH